MTRRVEVLILMFVLWPGVAFYVMIQARFVGMSFLALRLRVSEMLSLSPSRALTS